MLAHSKSSRAVALLLEQIRSQMHTHQLRLSAAAALGTDEAACVANAATTGTSEIGASPNRLGAVPTKHAHQSERKILCGAGCAHGVGRVFEVGPCGGGSAAGKPSKSTAQRPSKDTSRGSDVRLSSLDETIGGLESDDDDDGEFPLSPSGQTRVSRAKRWRDETERRRDSVSERRSPVLRCEYEAGSYAAMAAEELVQAAASTSAETARQTKNALESIVDRHNGAQTARRSVFADEVPTTCRARAIAHYWSLQPTAAHYRPLSTPTRVYALSTQSLLPACSGSARTDAGGA